MTLASSPWKPPPSAPLCFLPPVTCGGGLAYPHLAKVEVALLLCGGKGARGEAELVPRGGDLLHERHVRRGQSLVLPKQRVCLLNLCVEPLL